MSLVNLKLKLSQNLGAHKSHHKEALKKDTKVKINKEKQKKKRKSKNQPPNPNLNLNLPRERVNQNSLFLIK